MISSRRGVAIAIAIAVVLAIAVVVDLGSAPAVANRALVPGFDPERVTALIWERAGQPAVDVVRTQTSWQIRAPSSAPADPAAISDVLAALRGARWHRRGDAMPTHATLTIASGTQRRGFGIGEPIAGTDQVWIVDGDRGLVVDSWVARALDRELLSLRIRAPLADVRRARSIVIESAGTPEGASERIAVRIEGAPRRLVRPVELLLAADVVGELERALGELTVVRLPTGPVTARGLAITIADADPSGTTGTTGTSATGTLTVELGGSCPGAPALVAMSGTAGDGCVERAAATSIEQGVARLRQRPEGVVERRPVPFEPERVVLADGVALELRHLRVGGRPADQARVAELLAALGAPAEAVTLPVMAATQRLVVTDHGGATTTLELFSEGIVARQGEPVALRPAPGAWRLLARASRELRDLGVWLEEPTTITKLRIDDITYRRGAVIGAWTREPPGPVDAGAVEALVALLAAPRATGFLDGPVAVAHRVMITITPPAGPAIERVLEMGRRCAARIDQETVLLSPTTCVQIAALAK